MAADTADQLVLLGRAFELQQAGRLPEAEALYAQVLAANPDDATALVNAGAVALARGDLALAIARSERVVRLAPRNALARNNLGFALIHAGRDSEALAVLDRAIALNGDFAQAHNNRGIALARLGRAAEGIAAFERALLLEPRYGEAALNLGDQCNSAGDGVRAAAAFERVLAVQPDARRCADRACVRARRCAATCPARSARSRPSRRPTRRTRPHGKRWAPCATGRGTMPAPSSRSGMHCDWPRPMPTRNSASRRHCWRGATMPRAGGRSSSGRTAAAESGAAFAQIPVWDGAPFAGTLVVFGEQGFGDVVQFARFIAPARARVGRIVLLLDGYRAPLAPLLASVAGVDAGRHEGRPDIRGGWHDRARLHPLACRFHLGIGSTSSVPPAAISRLRRTAPPRGRRAWQPSPCRAWVSHGRCWRATRHGFVTRHKSVPVHVLAPILAAHGVSRS